MVNHSGKKIRIGGFVYFLMYALWLKISLASFESLIPWRFWQCFFEFSRTILSLDVFSWIIGFLFCKISVSTRNDRDSCNLSDLQKKIVFSKRKTGKHLNEKKNTKESVPKHQINANFTTKSKNNITMNSVQFCCYPIEFIKNYKINISNWQIEIL